MSSQLLLSQHLRARIQHGIDGYDLNLLPVLREMDYFICMTLALAFKLILEGDPA